MTRLNNLTDTAGLPIHTIVARQLDHRGHRKKSLSLAKFSIEKADFLPRMK